jgi:large subunit ribosomal protein L4
MELKVLDNKGKSTSTVTIDDALLASDASRALLHEVIVAHNAAQRSGTHNTLTRTEVSGGGIKPWKQKGTGRARSGSTRSPLWRHGGIIFGPRPRSYRQDIPKSKKRTAFKMAIADLIKEDRFQVVDPIKVSEQKTKAVAAVYKSWQAPTDSLLVVEKIDAAFNRISRNIANVHVMDVESLSAYDALRARKLFITAAALDQLKTRISGASAS